jgi:hypothetical protein
LRDWIRQDTNVCLRHGFRSGIFGLGRKFKIMDDDGSKSINMAEFLNAMRETEVNLDEATLRKLFSVSARFTLGCASTSG